VTGVTLERDAFRNWRAKSEESCIGQGQGIVAKSRGNSGKELLIDAKLIIQSAHGAARGISVAAGRGGEGLAMLGLFLRPGGIEKVEDTANCPIAEGDSEYEGN